MRATRTLLTIIILLLAANAMMSCNNQDSIANTESNTPEEPAIPVPP